MQIGDGPRRRRGLSAEERLHLQVADFLTAAIRPPVFWTTIDHGAGRLSGRSAGMMKARGVKSGLPDILVMMPRSIPANLPTGPLPATRVIGIELKAEQGRVSHSQEEMGRVFAAVNADYVVCRTVEVVAMALEVLGVPLHARLMSGGGVMKAAA